MNAEERARKLMERFGGEHPDLRPGFAAVTIEALTETIRVAQREAEVMMRERCIIALTEKLPQHGPIHVSEARSVIRALPSEYGEESCHTSE